MGLERGEVGGVPAASRPPRRWLVLAVTGALAGSACGGQDGDGANMGPDDQSRPTYQVGGTVAGLEDGPLHLALNGTELVEVAADGDFAFAGELDNGSTYDVTTVGQPEGQRCDVLRGSGTIVGRDVLDVAVECVDATGRFSVGGQVSGLTEGTLQLVLNDSELLQLTGDGNFQFATLLADQEPYEVRLLGQPVGNRCTVAAPSGAVSGADVTDIEISCDYSAELTDLNLSPGLAVAPAFDPTDHVYTAAARYFTPTVQVSALPFDPGATLWIDGQSVPHGDPSSGRFLELGSASAITIEVESASGLRETYVIAIERAWPEQVAYGKASNPGRSDFFGQAIALSGDTLVVGAPGEGSAATGVDGNQNDDSQRNSGAAYVFRRNGSGGWSQEAYLKASNTETGDSFGGAVAVSGGTIAIGASSEDSDAKGIDGDDSDNTASRSGAVYIFQRSGNTWSQEAYLKASNTEAGDFFGRSLALDGDVLAAGASGEDADGSSQDDNSELDSGAVYVFRRTGSTWSQEAYLKAGYPDSGDGFGVSLGLSGATLAIGASGEDGTSTVIDGDPSTNGRSDSGAVYLYEYDGSAWTPGTYFKAPNAESDDRFGGQVALSGDVLVAGATGEESSTTLIDGNADDNGAPGAGAAYVFRRAGGPWALDGYLKASNTGSGDSFGESVAISGDFVAVGASSEDGGGTGVNSDGDSDDSGASGAVYLFHYEGGSWRRDAYLKTSNNDPIDFFGWRVVLSARELIAVALAEDSSSAGFGGDQSDNDTSGSGAIYIFE